MPGMFKDNLEMVVPRGLYVDELPQGITVRTDEKDSVSQVWRFEHHSTISYRASQEHEIAIIILTFQWMFRKFTSYHFSFPTMK